MRARATPLLSRKPAAGGRRCSNTALAFTRQQMIDMGLVPPEGAEQEAQDLLLSRAPSTEEEGAGGHPAAMADDAEEPAEAVGLIGHFEASRLLAQKGKEGTFVGSLDMSMTERELVSTEEGVGEGIQFGLFCLLCDIRGLAPMVAVIRQTCVFCFLLVSAQV